MKRIFLALLTLGILVCNMGAAFAALPVDQVLPTGGGYSVTCQGFGIEMRGNSVKSCFLAVPGDFPTAAQKKIPCAAKYAVAFRSDGRVAYCTLGVDMPFNRTEKETLLCKAGGRVVLRNDGTVQAATLADRVELPYKKKATVACRGASPATFWANGNVETCILDRESVFVTGEKKSLEKTCVVGGLIAFDEDGIFSGCYPPAPPKGSISQGGQTP